ncbi:MAG: 30S ribosomal protein S4 [Nanoarchaeota archaeon]
MLKRKKQFSRPKKPWQLSRIKEENQLAKEYGLRNKKELWRTAELLKNWRELAKQTVSLAGEEQARESKILLTKLQKYGIVSAEADIDDVLALDLKRILEKRLQTLVYKNSMALTPKQARQFITHNKVTVNGEKVSSPAYLVKTSDKIAFIHGFKPNLVSPAKAQELKADLAEARKVKTEMKEKAEVAVREVAK